MTTSKRRELERKEVREKILDAARELFVAHGYEGVSMRKVAERIDYSSTAIYLHFADKEALFRELCEQDFLQLSDAFKDLASISDPAERLTACGSAYIKFAIAHPNHYRLMFMSTRPDIPAISDEALARRGNPSQDAYAFLLTIVRDIMAEGAFRTDLTDTHLIAQTLWAAVHGVASLEIAMKDDAWIKWRSLSKRQSAIMDSIMTGLIRKKE